MWNIVNGNCLTTFNGHKDTVRCVIGLKNVNIVSGSYDRSLKIWS